MDTLFTCTRCDPPKRYKSRRALVRHKRVHDLSHTFDCKHCGKKFYESWTLARHTSTIHDKKNMYVCTEGGKCAWGFVSAHKENLAKHKKEVHYKVKRQLSLSRCCALCWNTLHMRVAEARGAPGLCVKHAQERGVKVHTKRPAGSLAACRCWDTLNRVLGLNLQHIHFGSNGSVHGSEMEELIPGTKFKPDAMNPEYPMEIWEFLGNPWHGYPPGHWNYHGMSHIHVSHAELYQQTMTRFYAFRDHGFTVHYIWEHEWRNVRTLQDVLNAIHVVDLKNMHSGK